MLDQLRTTVRGYDLAWRRLDVGSPLIGQTLADANLRAQTGASVIVLIRDQQVQPNPKSGTRFEPGDLIGLMGDAAQLAAVDRLLAATQSN